MHRNSCTWYRVVPASIAAVILVSSTVMAANGARGGRLYDKWWAVNGADAPTGDHPLYPPEAGKSGSTTYRCKECHGWDYKGAAGAYGSGSHYTGISGVFESPMTPQQMFDIIKKPDGDGTGGTAVNGHDFGNIGLTDADINDLVEFLQSLVIDTRLYINRDKMFLGSMAQGEMHYNGAGMCATCHGNDGAQINFGSPEDPEWVGTIAVVNPWELLHKIRFGQPDGTMPGSTMLSLDEIADLGRYAQLRLKTGLDSGGPVPLASQWSMIVATLTLLVAGTVALRSVKGRSVRRPRRPGV